MKISLKKSLLLFGLLSLLVFSYSAHAQSGNDSDDDDYEEEGKVEPEPVVNQTNVGDSIPTMPEHPHHEPMMPVLDEKQEDQMPDDLHVISPDHIDHEKALNAFIVSGESERFPNRTNETITIKYSFDAVKRSLFDLYHDSSNLWSNWKKRAGDKWDEATKSIKDVNSADDAEKRATHEAYSIFYNAIKQLEDYKNIIKQKSIDISAEKQRDLKEAYDKFYNSFENLKSEVKGTIEGLVTEKKTENATKEDSDGSDSAIMRFQKMKEALDFHIQNILDGARKVAQDVQSTGASTYDTLRSKAKELFSNSANSLDALKQKIGDKVQNSGSEFGKKLYTRWGGVVDEMSSMQAFFNKNFTKLSHEARGILDQYLVDLNNQYNTLKQQTETLAASIARGISKPEKVVEEAYETALSAYTVTRGKIQNEIDYINGKITKAQYHAATGMKRNYERIISETYKVFKQIKNAANHAGDESYKVLESLAEKVKELYLDSASTFVKLDVKFAPYWDSVTGQLNKVDDETSKIVRETLQYAIVEFQDLNHMLESMYKGFRGKVPDAITSLVEELRQKYTALKTYTEDKYNNWNEGSAGDATLQKNYEKAREEFLDTKEALHVELNDFFEDEEDIKKHRVEL